MTGKLRVRVREVHINKILQGLHVKMICVQCISHGQRIKVLHYINSLAPRICGCNFDCMILKHISVTDIWIISCNYPQLNAKGSYWWRLNIGSGNGLVSPDNKPLPEPVLTQLYVTIWCHNELSLEFVLSFVHTSIRHTCGIFILLEENTTRKLLSLSLDLFFKISLFQVTFLIYCFLLLSFILTFI